MSKDVKVKKQARAKSRQERGHNAARVFSTNFMTQMLAHEGKCFVALQDFRTLEKKYCQLFKRYKKYV